MWVVIADVLLVCWRLWGSGITARASCLARSFDHLVNIFERGGLVVVLEFRTDLLMILLKKLQRIEEDEGNWVTMKGSMSKTTDLV